MRTIIAGGRNICDYSILSKAVSEISWVPTVIISGTANGADKLGERWANENNIPIERYPADWNKYGKGAGYIRNSEMSKNADCLLALWDGKSRGTKHMIDIATKDNLEVHVYRIDLEDTF